MMFGPIRPGLAWLLTWVGVASFPLILAAQEPAGDEPAAPTQLSPANEAEREQRFLQGLRERGYFDLALSYVENQLAREQLPASLRSVYAYELGRGLLEEATNSADLDRRGALLEQARAKLADFTTKYPGDPLASEALTQLARLQVERGHTALLQANEIKTTDEQGKPIASAKGDRDSRLAGARAAFTDARQAYDQAHTRLKTDFDAFPKFIADRDPRRRARDRAHTALMDEELQRAVVEYEDAQTYPFGSKERDKILDDAGKRFEDLYNRYRDQLAGLHARMLQGKSMEEKGDLGQAMGLYDELMQHGDAQLKPLQRKVGYFRIIVLGKRKEYPLAVDEAARWLAAFPNARNTEEGLGVQLELAKNLLAQLPDLNSDDDKDQATRKAVERLTEVVRYYSPHKPEALALLQQYQPKAAKRANQLTNLSYDDAMSQADTAISAHDWSLAEGLLKQAIRKGEQARDYEKVNRSRYFLAYVNYATDRYYEAAALADHVARRYPSDPMGPRAAELGLASLTQAYNLFTQVDRQSDLDRLNDLGSYTAKTWPDTEQADNARMTLGEIALGRGQFAEASSWLESVRENSPKRQDALVKAGDAHWRFSRKLRDQGDSEAAERETNSALDLVQNALKAREAANVPMTDPGRLGNINALAEIHRASGRPGDAIALLTPIAKSVETATPSPELAPLYTAGLSILLRSYLAAGEPTQATTVMATLERISPSKSALTQLYFELGRTLKAELENLESSNKGDAYKKTLDAYRQFLQALASSQVGQSFDSLEWAGESLLDLKLPKEAAELFERVLKTYAEDPAFLKQEDSPNKLLRARRKLVSALRQSGDTVQARTMVDDLINSNKNVLELLMEKGLVIEDQARGARQTKEKAKFWQESLGYWQKLAQQLRTARNRKTEGFEAWYHVALAEEGLGKKEAALATLKGIVTVSPSVGNPEMKKKYEDLIKRLGK
jgi:tetratricopeptide (TPR) repeat protein